MTWTYQEALEYLNRFTNYEISNSMYYTPESISLDRPRLLLERLGNPHHQYPVIHITGTKGKGSVGALCTAGLQASGLKVGFYSSPHLQALRERYRINDALIDEASFAKLVQEMQPVIESIADLTWFEITTAMAFVFAAQQQVDVMVCEVGLGGRLDATNIVQPIVSVITSISYDHMLLLGDTLDKITREKVGIIKPGVPVVSAPQPAEAAAVIAQAAEAQAAPLTLVGRDWHYQVGPLTQQGQALRAGNGLMHDYWIPLLGAHQAINAAVALATIDQVQMQGVPVNWNAIAGGLRNVLWPGRFEIVGQAPLLILDSAHNGESAQRVRQTLDTLFPDRQELVLVFGTSRGKDVPGMFDALLPITTHLLLTEAQHPRASSSGTLAAAAEHWGYRGHSEQLPAPADALDRAAQLAGPDGLILVAGSLFLVGEIRTLLGLTPGQAAAPAQPFQITPSPVREFISAGPAAR